MQYRKVVASIVSIFKNITLMFLVDSDGELEKLLNDYISRECDSRGLVDIIGRPIQRITDYNQYIHVSNII